MRKNRENCGMRLMEVQVWDICDVGSNFGAHISYHIVANGNVPRRSLLGIFSKNIYYMLRYMPRST